MLFSPAQKERLQASGRQAFCCILIGSVSNDFASKYPKKVKMKKFPMHLYYNGITDFIHLVP